MSDVTNPEEKSLLNDDYFQYLIDIYNSNMDIEEEENFSESRKTEKKTL